MARITFKVEFVSKEISAFEAFQDLEKATENASVNLFAKYNIQLELPRIIEDNIVVLDVFLPDSLAKNFNIGPHMKGIAAYLLKQCSGYERYIVSKRLLTYTIIPAPDESNNLIPVGDRLRAISDFAKLLEKNDRCSVKKIQKIMNILKEV